MHNKAIYDAKCNVIQSLTVAGLGLLTRLLEDCHSTSDSVMHLLAITWVYKLRSNFDKTAYLHNWWQIISISKVG